MFDAGWDRITDAIDIKFGITEHGKRTEPLEDKPELSQTIQFVGFTQHGDDYRLERRSGPAIIDRKTIHHKAAGSSVRFENVYDPDEITHKIHLLRKNDAGEWEEIDPSALAI